MLCNKSWLLKTIPQARVYGLSDHETITLNPCIDSRTLQPGEFFVALVGAKVDGHTFIASVVEQGAVGLIVNENRYEEVIKNLTKPLIVIGVPDTLEALFELARAWRSTLTIPLVGITGSVGKTSTKGLIASILSTAGIAAYVSYKNQNTIIGLCLNLLKVAPEHTCGVFELGINDQGEMLPMVEILRPTLALVTTITNAHVSRIGSLEDIAKEKRTIFHFLSPSNVGIICGDVSLLTSVGYTHPIARFGTKTSNHVQARKIAIIEKENNALHITFTLKWYGEKAHITLPTHHRGMINNALAAATIAYHLGIPLSAVIQGIESYRGVDQRFEMKPMQRKKGTIINDCYNANPESMKAALIAFDALKTGGKKIAVLGNMLELGSRDVYWHRRIGRLIRQLSSLHKVILVGELAQHMAYSIPTHIQVSCAKDWQEACSWLDTYTNETEDALVLVKGSLGMSLSKLVESFS